MVGKTYTIRTARGPKAFSPADGITLPHEHVVIDSRVWWEGEGDWHEFDDPATLAVTTWDEIKVLPQALVRENMILSDWYLGAKELRLAKEVGVQLIVDLTVLGSGPNTAMAVRAAEAAGLDIVISSGRYLHDTLATEERSVSVEQLTDRWSAEIHNGINGLFPGIIGEIGTSETIRDDEIVSLIAAARTQQQTGLPLNIHVHPYAHLALDAIRIVEAAGADLRAIGISHLDCDLNLPELAQILETGVFVEFDNFGTGRGRLVQNLGYPDDSERLDVIDELCQRGYHDRILLSHDINHRNSLVANGGWGYRHIGANIRPLLQERFGEAVSQQLVAINPLQFLSNSHLDQHTK